jgi:hypothetical protein
MLFTTLLSRCRYASTLPFPLRFFYPASFQCKVPWKPALNTTAPMLFTTLCIRFALCFFHYALHTLCTTLPSPLRFCHAVTTLFTTVHSCFHCTIALCPFHYAFTTLFRSASKPALNTTAPMLFLSRYALHYAFLCPFHYAFATVCTMLFTTLSLPFDTLAAVPCSNEPALKQRA